ncbi:MAG: TetR/AcrR family transcriptional regulator [Polyangiaceae bacterium]|nr:TetR/AcrR family transcriptional regulator C-terminal domain-containing protein [Myxococcales bacterium]MCB9586220.1 TetR/AcrR family transcriptional regulator [Polyangiaceae bacterium]MCB9606897.1 TetR/AcrR family transcriptional regulator [Polyangiaceae bacterium]
MPKAAKPTRSRASRSRAAEPKPTREPLSRERILEAALGLANRSGIAGLSMRKLGDELGVEAMSLYNHIANKDELIDALIDRVVSEIELPTTDEHWKAAMRKRAVSAREVFKRYPWVTALMETRKNPGPAALRYYDSVIGCLRRGGFSIAMAAHAFALVDSYLYGFALQEQSLPFETPDEANAVAEEMLEELPLKEFPYLTEMIVDHAMKPGYSFAAEFEYGLDLILDGLERTKKKR